MIKIFQNANIYKILSKYNLKKQPPTFRYYENNENKCDVMFGFFFDYKLKLDENDEKDGFSISTINTGKYVSIIMKVNIIFLIKIREITQN
jgi:hypothetical protein